MENSEIIVVDQTIREGMQFRGLMFSPDERMKILEFQEAVGVDISQVAYPPAHESELECVKVLRKEAQRRKYNVRVAGLCRALVADVSPLVDMGMSDFHLHTVATKEMLGRQSVKTILATLKETIHFIRSHVSNPCIEVSLLDVGKTSPDILQACVEILIDELHVDMLTLPDTSGIMAPNELFEKIKSVVRMAEGKQTRIGVHCHNDMGMGTANTIMGVIAGASVVQSTALGIGERNGIGDLFIIGKCLKDQGYDLNLKTENPDLFREYYSYVNDLCVRKTELAVLDYRTPVFGDAMKTHVAGTHAMGTYGAASDEAFYLNVLCGKQLVGKYLNLHNIKYDKSRIKDIVEKIKSKSVEMKRAVTHEEVTALIQSI